MLCTCVCYIPFSPRDRPYRPDSRERERYSGGRDSYRGYHRRSSGGGRYYESSPPPGRGYRSSRESKSYRRGRDHGSRYDDSYYDDYSHSHGRYRSRSPPSSKDYYHR